MDPLVAPLFVPGNRPERFAKAAASGADAVIVDLEDAVAPEDKAAARANAAAAAAALPGVAVYVRINPAGTPWYAEDVAALADSDLAGLLLPKAENPATVDAMRRQIGAMDVIALVESARGIAAAREIAAGGVVALAFGSLDYAADLGCAHTRPALLHARSELVLASRLAGIGAPLDGVTARIADEDLAEDDARHAAELGFGGKLVIHPRQVAPVRRGFAPDEAEVSWAREVMAADSGGAVAVGGMMIDAPVRLRAGRILARAGG